jgi:hypothetical protein
MAFAVYQQVTLEPAKLIRSGVFSESDRIWAPSKRILKEALVNCWNRGRIRVRLYN